MTFEIALAKATDAASLSEANARKALAERQDYMKNIFDEAGPDYDPAKVSVVEFKDGAEMSAHLRNLNGELEEIGKRVKHFDELSAIRGRVEDGAKNRGESKGSNFQPKEDESFKGLGKSIRESGILAKAAHAKSRVTFNVENFDAKAWLQKTVFSTGAGWAPESTRTGRLVLDEQREIEVTQIFPVYPTNQAAIKYMEETTFTNNAAEREEGGAYVESALALTEQSETVRSVGTSLPVTDEQLEDEEGAEAYLENRLGFMVRQRLDGQLVAGDGNAPNIRGTLAVGSILTQAKGSDSVMDAVYKAIRRIKVEGRALPSAVIANPIDWEAVVLMKTADGVYIWGAPSQIGGRTAWGLPVVETSAVTENTLLVGDYARYAGLHVRKGLTIEVGYVNDDFLDGRKTFRAGLRVAAVHYRPKAFCQVTGV